MFAITGITGQVGSTIARTLLAQGREVRAIVRTEDKGAAWAKLGCEVAVAALEDTEALTRAFTGTEGVFAMLPPIFDPAPGFPEAHALIASLSQALAAAQPPKVVFLSTIGGHVTRPNLLNQLHEAEEKLRTLPLPITFLRAGWFMENAIWDVAPARDAGILPSLLQPLDKPVPMVATEDVGTTAAQLLLEPAQGLRIVELEGPRRITPNEVAAAFSKLLGHPVQPQAIPRATWEDLFRSHGMKNPTPRIQMLDGFNEGWIEFESGPANSRKGTTTIDTVLQALINSSAKQ